MERVALGQEAPPKVRSSLAAVRYYIRETEIYTSLQFEDQVNRHVTVLRACMFVNDEIIVTECTTCMTEILTRLSLIRNLDST